MMVEFAAHLTSLINAFKAKNIEREFPFFEEMDFVKQKDGVVYT